jgi:hypothetical protein
MRTFVALLFIGSLGLTFLDGRDFGQRTEENECQLQTSDELVQQRSRCSDAPLQSHFRSEYNKDSKNKQRQSWDDYWDWVQKFYNGNTVFFQKVEGWKVVCSQLVRGVQSSKRQVVESEVCSLGRSIAGEWAKDNGVRKIDSDDVQKWKERLESARKRDDGTGNALLEEVKTISEEIRKKMAQR